jgi:hypothetical protein
MCRSSDNVDFADIIRKAAIGTTFARASYSRNIKGVSVDVYDVLAAFNITCPAQAHAAKKLLRNGKGAKSRAQDLREAIVSLERALEMMGEEKH